MAILIPTAIPVAFSLDNGSYGLTTIICLGAVLDGAIFGDHCSPLSDTTILSSIASSCDPLHHVRTQLPYSLTVRNHRFDLRLSSRRAWDLLSDGDRRWYNLNRLVVLWCRRFPQVSRIAGCFANRVVDGNEEKHPSLQKPRNEKGE